MKKAITHPGWSEIIVAGERTERTEIEVPIQIRVICSECGGSFEWSATKDREGNITVEVSKVGCGCLAEFEI